MIVKSYKSRSSESRAMFLLSSENFLQAYKRASIWSSIPVIEKWGRNKTKPINQQTSEIRHSKTAKQSWLPRMKRNVYLLKRKKTRVKISEFNKDKNKIAQK
jgi:hypothetical protein